MPSNVSFSIFFSSFLCACTFSLSILFILMLLARWYWCLRFLSSLPVYNDVVLFCLLFVWWESYCVTMWHTFFIVHYKYPVTKQTQNWEKRERKKYTQNECGACIQNDNQRWKMCFCIVHMRADLCALLFILNIWFVCKGFLFLLKHTSLSLFI